MDGDYTNVDSQYETMGDSPQTQQRYWMSEIQASEKELDKWHRRGKRVVKAYEDERDAIDENRRHFNLFWANTQIMKSALYSELPVPEVSRRFRNPSDDVGRVASLILERAIMYDLEKDDSFDEFMHQSVQDRLLPGLGCGWVRYEAETSEQARPLEDGTVEMVPVVTSQETPVDYVYWEDVKWSPARTWYEVRWVCRDVYLDKDAADKRFGERSKLITFKDYTRPRKSEGKNDTGPEFQILNRGLVHEIWCKDTKKVYWVTPEAPEVLDCKKDPYNLPEFFPCPKFLLSTNTTSNFMPIPDYTLVQDQYEELNTINARIMLLVQACRVAGVYDQNSNQIQNLLKGTNENQLIPVDSWAMFAERGGVKGAIDWLPLEQIIKTIAVLNEARNEVKQQIYELTGISDIIRGTTKASETATAQEIKAQYASVRLKDYQNEVGRFIRGIVRIKATLMLKFYPPQKLLEMSGEVSEPDRKYVEQAVMLLKEEQMRRMRIKVDVDTFTDVDWQYQKEARVEFLAAVGQYIERVAPVAGGQPEVAAILVAMLRFGMAGFKVSREVEGHIDAGMDALLEKAKQPPPPPPEDPSVTKEKIEAASEERIAELNNATKIAIAQMQAEQKQSMAEMQATLQGAMELLRDQGLQLEQQRAIMESKANQTSEINDGTAQI